MIYISCKVMVKVKWDMIWDNMNKIIRDFKAYMEVIALMPWNFNFKVVGLPLNPSSVFTKRVNFVSETEVI